MSDQNGAPVELYIAADGDPDAAQTDWDAIKALAREETITVDALVLVSRGTDGKIEVKDTFHTVGTAAGIGAVGGLLVGLIFPPALLASGAVGAAVGAGVGGLVSHAEKNDIKDEVGDDLAPGTSGIVALFEERWVADVEKAMPNADKVSKHEVDSAEQAKAAVSTA